MVICLGEHLEDIGIMQVAPTLPFLPFRKDVSHRSNRVMLWGNRLPIDGEVACLLFLLCPRRGWKAVTIDAEMVFVGRFSEHDDDIRNGIVIGGNCGCLCSVAIKTLLIRVALEGIQRDAEDAVSNGQRQEYQ